jgi:HK97 gp10 family phage protein
MDRNVVEIKITGTAELEAALESFPRTMAKAIVKKALKSAAGIWQQEMKAKVRQGWHVWKITEYKGAKYKGRSREWGALSRLIGIKVSVRGDELGGTATVGPVKKGFWALFLEFGTKRMGARPFIRPAFDSRANDVLNKYIEVARTELEAAYTGAGRSK